MKTKQKELREAMRARASMRRRLTIKVVFVLAGLALVLVALPVIMFGAVVCAVLQRWSDRLWSRTAVTLGLLPAVLAFGLVGDYAAAYERVVSGVGGTGDVVTVIVFGIAWSPLVGGLAARYARKAREAAPLTGPEAMKAREGAEDRRRTKTAQAVQKAAHGPESGSRVVIPRRVAQRLSVATGDAQGVFMGRYLRGDLPWEVKRACRVPRSAGSVAVMGRSRTGKSEAVHRMIDQAIERGEQVIYLNCKEAAPGAEPSRRLVALASELGRSYQVLIPGAKPYDVMRGTPYQVRNRLMDVELFSEPHHEAGTNVALAFGLHKLAMEGRPAQDLVDVLRQLVDRSAVAQWAVSDPFAAALLDMLDERSWSGTVQRYAADALDLRGWIGGRNAGGFAYEDAAVTAVDFPTSTEPKSARMLLRMVLSDLEAYLTSERRPRGEGGYAPLLVVLEELSALDSDPVIGRRVVNMTERMLGANARACVVTQDYSGLGDDRTADAVINGMVLMTFQQSNRHIEEIAKAAGTRQVPEASGTYTGRLRQMRGSKSGSVRMQETFAVHPNEIRNLGVGECFVIDRGKYAKCAITMGPKAFEQRECEAVKVLDAQRQRARIERETDTGMIDPGDGGMIIGEGDV